MGFILAILINDDGRVNYASLSIGRAQAEARKHGCVIRQKDEYGEYRVNFSGGREATAYYTDDLGDAVGTMLAMAKEGEK